MTASPATKRERQHRRSMDRTPRIADSVHLDGNVVAVDFNRFSQDERAELAHVCAVEAVQTGFSYLALSRIIAPPRTDKVAQLARQIAIHIMVHALHIEQRHVCRMQGRQRTSIHFALQAVKRRLECEVFAQAYERMASEAQGRFEGALEAV